MGIQRQGAAGSEGDVEGEAAVGAIEHLLDLYAEGLGHAHAAEFRVTAQTDPAACGIGGISLPESVGGGHLAVVPHRSLFIAVAVQRGYGLRGDLAGLFQHGIGSLGIDGAVQAWQALPQLVSFKDLVQHKADITQGGLVLSHGNSSAINKKPAQPDQWPDCSLRTFQTIASCYDFFLSISHISLCARPPSEPPNKKGSSRISGEGGLDLQKEVINVAVSVSHAFDHFDLVIDPFKLAGMHWPAHSGQDASPVRLQY